MCLLWNQAISNWITTKLNCADYPFCTARLRQEVNVSPFDLLCVY